MRHFRATWASDDPADPRILLYEASGDDKVKRSIEIFEDGRIERDSVDWHAREALRGVDSLVEGAFLAHLPQPGDPLFTCSEIGRAEFEAEWDLSGAVKAAPPLGRRQSMWRRPTRR